MGKIIEHGDVNVEQLSSHDRVRQIDVHKYWLEARYGGDVRYTETVLCAETNSVADPFCDGVRHGVRQGHLSRQPSKRVHFDMTTYLHINENNYVHMLHIFTCFT